MILEAAVRPIIGAAVVVNHYKLEAAITSLMVGIGIPLLLFSLPLWLVAAQSIA